MPTRDDERARRLAEALRQNLRRRKQQKRESAEQAQGHGDGDRQCDDDA